MSRRKRIALVKQDDRQVKSTFFLKQVSPITARQEEMFEAYNDTYNDGLMAIGSAGTGKTWCALYLALKDVYEERLYDRIIIVRTAVQTRDQGFLPGNLAEKMASYETPYVDIVNDLFDRSDAYKMLKEKGIITFMSSSFVRGLTFNNAIIIFDEAQNANADELRSVMTRVGEGSKILFCGDTKQDDLKAGKNKNDKSGLGKFIEIIEHMGDIPIVKFDRDDIVRSGIVKRFIIAEEELAEMNG